MQEENEKSSHTLTLAETRFIFALSSQGCGGIVRLVCVACSSVCGAVTMCDDV